MASIDAAVSVSKGVFVFKNGFKPPSKSKKNQKKAISTEHIDSNSNELWYITFRLLWNTVENKVEILKRDMFSNILTNLVSFIKTSYENPVDEIPAGALLTGINMPDHAAQFSALAKEIQNYVSPHVAILYSQDCQSLKHFVENMINQIVNEEEFSSDEEDQDDTKHNRVKKSQCNFALLQSWYEDLYADKTTPKVHNSNTNRKVMVLIFPDFESFKDTVLQDFILIISSYINILPFVLVFGIATSLTSLNKSLPHHVSSKVNIQVFNSQPSTTYLNNILEYVFFTPDCQFHLGGKVFTLLTDIFLYYDFSVTGFIQNFKYAMIEHYSKGNVNALCANRKDIKLILLEFNHDDFEEVRRLFSFRKFVENQSHELRIQLLTDDVYFGKVLRKELKKMYNYLDNFHFFIKCLYILVMDLPKSPLGKQIREIYSVATSGNITKTSEYKECFQLLKFHSKDELVAKVQKICKEIKSQYGQDDVLFVYYNDLVELVNEIEYVTSENYVEDDVMEDESQDEPMLNTNMDRRQLKEKLLELSIKPSKPMTRYEKTRIKLIEYISTIMENHLMDHTELTFHEIFFFDDLSIKSNIIGSHRAAIHQALNDPHSYLQCKCCELPNDGTILRTMPDICIAYKLHLEYGKIINLYDWLQAFLSILDPVGADDDEKTEVNPELQARFTQCVAELELLGFVKSSKRKTDHVTRLTWGG